MSPRQHASDGVFIASDRLTYARRNASLHARLSARQPKATSGASASRYSRAEERDRSGLGASRFREGRVVMAEEGEEFRVLFSGLVWWGELPTAEPLFDPAATTEIPTA